MTPTQYVYNDTYTSGDPSLQQVVTVGVTAGLAFWRLPGCEHLLVTPLTDFNRHFPYLQVNETQWRNAANARKRAKMGIATEEDQDFIVVTELHEKEWKAASQMLVMKK